MYIDQPRVPYFGGWHPQNIPRKKNFSFHDIFGCFITMICHESHNSAKLFHISHDKSDFKTSLAPPHLAGANAWPRHCLSGIGPRSFWSEQRSLTIIDSFCRFLNTPVKIKGYCIFPLKWVFEIFSHPYPPSKVHPWCLGMSQSWLLGIFCGLNAWPQGDELGEWTALPWISVSPGNVSQQWPKPLVLDGHEGDKIWIYNSTSRCRC